MQGLRADPPPRKTTRHKQPLLSRNPYQSQNTASQAEKTNGIQSIRHYSKCLTILNICLLQYESLNWYLSPNFQVQLRISFLPIMVETNKHVQKTASILEETEGTCADDWEVGDGSAT